MTKLWTVFLFSISLLATAGWAEAPAPYTGPVWALLDPAKVLAAAADITPAKYPDSDQATVDEKTETVCRTDGTGESQDETYLKVLTEKGLRESRTVEMDYMIPYNSVSVVRLEVIRPDGKIVPVDVAANSQESIDDSQMAENIYDPSQRVLKVSIPQLEIGDIVHSVTRQTTDRPVIPGQSEGLNMFEGAGYLRHLLYEVHMPKDRPLTKTAVRNEIPGKVRYTQASDPENGVDHRWEVTDVPRFFGEPNQPPEDEVLQRLYYSTDASWQDVSKWYWALSKPHLDAVSPELKATVGSLTATAKSDDEKAKALFYFVSKKIRYMGLTLETDRPGMEPHDVKLTFDKKYGVCRDKAALLVSMLRLAGLDAYPVLINLGAKRDSEVPMPFFDHAIVAWALPQGGYQLMDPTDENTRKLLPDYDGDQSFLVCRPEGEDLKVSPVEPAAENLMKIRTQGVLTAAGRLEAQASLAFDGANDDAYRNAFSKMKPEDQRKFFEARLKAVLPGARLGTLTLTPQDMADMDSPLKADLTFTVDGMTARGGGKALVTVPWIGRSFGLINFLVRDAGLETRKYPMKTYYACGVDETFSVRLADGFAGQVSLPEGKPVDNGQVSYLQSFVFGDRTLQGVRQFLLKEVEFSPTQYLALKQVLKTMDYDAWKEPVAALEAGTQDLGVPAAAEPALPAPDSNAEVLSVHKELDAADGHTSVYKVSYTKKILTYAGKVGESEIKIPYNPATQDVKFLQGTVVSKTGEKHEIGPQEINRMDEGWNSSAKRYTGGKVLVANLPGVEIGSTIDVSYEVTTHDRIFLRGFEAFQLSDRMDGKTFVLKTPAQVPVTARVTGPQGEVTAQVADQGQDKVRHWASAPTAALPSEGNLPPDWVWQPGVQFFVGDFETEVRALCAALDLRAGHRTQAAETAKKLTAQAKSPREAVQAIRDFVARTIRAAGPDFTDLPLSELSDADTTLTDGYGHRADRAILLHALLGAAGFAPSFVLATDLPGVSPFTETLGSFPMVRDFGALLVKVTVDGQTLFLNDTDQYAPLGASAHEGDLGLALDTLKYEIIRPASGAENRSETQYRLSVTDQGQGELEVENRFYGTACEEKRKYYSELPPEERRRHFQDLVSAFAQGAQPVGNLVTDFTGYPGFEKYTVKLDNFAVVTGGDLYFDRPFSLSLFPVATDRRALPYYIPRKTESTVTLEVTLPQGYHPTILPPTKVLEAPGAGKVTATETATATGFQLTYNITAFPGVVDPKDYTALVSVQTALGQRSSKTVLLEKEPAAGGTP